MSDRPRDDEPDPRPDAVEPQNDATDDAPGDRREDSRERTDTDPVDPGVEEPENRADPTDSPGI